MSGLPDMLLARVAGRLVLALFARCRQDIAFQEPDIILNFEVEVLSCPNAGFFPSTG